MPMKKVLIITILLMVATPVLMFSQKRTVKTKLSLTENTFYIKNVASGRYLDLPGSGYKAKKENGSKVQLWDFGVGKDRQFKFIKTGDYYQIRCQHTASNLDVHGCYKDKLFCGTYKNENGAPIQIWKAKGNGGKVQHWKLVQVNPGQFKMVNEYSGKVLDASASNIKKNGCKVQIWTWKGKKNQLWELVDVKTATRYQE